nr:PREDICTED: neurturin [Latimeria chalumnae]|eukprot:XP_005989987.1 PREDICTED: neurturin [Latimeria chalumnae]
MEPLHLHVTGIWSPYTSMEYGALTPPCHWDMELYTSTSLGYGAPTPPRHWGMEPLQLHVTRVWSPYASMSLGYEAPTPPCHSGMKPLHLHITWSFNDLSCSKMKAESYFITTIIIFINSNSIASWTSPETPQGLGQQASIDLYLLERYTETEIREVVSTLINRYGSSNDRRSARSRQAGGRAKRARSQKPCSLKELEVTVTDLGLGYESEETVLFKYCTGTCEAAAKHYDKTLKNMRKNKMIKRGKDRPCCRPLSYDDDVSFLDNYHEYHTLKELSAKECGCV